MARGERTKIFYNKTIHVFTVVLLGDHMGLLTLHDLFCASSPAYARPHALPAHVRRAARALLQGRPAALGGHVQACPDGQRSRIWDNSCRHRSCPQCVDLQTEPWLARQQARLLACAHSHVIFTLPHDLTPLWLAHVPGMTAWLCQAVRATLCPLLAAPQYLGAPPGMLAALHPWSQPLGLHPPVPCLVTGGGLTPTGPWGTVRNGFFLPVRGGRAVLRGKILAALRRAWARDELVLPAALRPQQWLNRLKRLGPAQTTPWHVPMRERSRHGAGVVTYRARSLRGGPRKHARLGAWEGDRVTFL